MRPRNVYDIALYTYLLTLGGGEHRLCTKDTALLLGMSKKTLLEARRRLEMEGLIEVEKGQGQMGAVYRVRSVEECEEEWRRRRGEMRESVGVGESADGHGKPEKPDGESKEDTDGQLADRGQSPEAGAEMRDGSMYVGVRSVEVTDGLADEVMRSEQQWIETLCVKNRLTREQVEAMLREFVDTLQCDAVERKEMGDFKHHFSRWLKIEVAKRNNNSNNTYNTYGQQRRQDGGHGRQERGQTKQEQREEQIRRRKSDDIARLQRLSAKYGGGMQGGDRSEGGLRQSGGVHGGLESEGAAYPFK